MANLKQGWDNPPAVVLLSGTDEFYLGREIKKAYRGANVSKRTVMHAETVEAFRSVMDIPFITETPSMLFITGGDRKKEGWTEEDIQMIATNSDRVFCMVVVTEGEAGAGSLAARVKELLPKVSCLTYTKPAVWDMEKYASQFLVTEMNQYDKRLSPKLAASIVTLVGTDYGVLSFEALKYATAADEKGVTEIDSSLVRSLMFCQGATDYKRLIGAVGARDMTQVLRAANDIQSGPVGTTGPLIACRALASQIVLWLQVAHLQEQGFRDAEIAQRLEIKTGRLHYLLPPVQVWKTKGLVALLKSIAEVDRSVRKGCLSPWVVFQTALINSVQSP